MLTARRRGVVTAQEGDGQLPDTRLLLSAAVAASATMLFASTGVATAADPPRSAQRGDTAPNSKQGFSPFGSRSGRSAFSAEPQPGVNPQGLPPRRENVDLVSKLTFKSGPGGTIAAGQIADVAVHKNTAYLNSWSEPEGCARGGFFVADISNPAQPREIGFVPALPNSYHGEGAHVITLNTSAFKGDVLVTNNEPCSNAPTDADGNPLAAGGFDLYDVSNPAAVKPLVRGFGDTGPDVNLDDPIAEPGSLTGNAAYANSSHSSFLWQDNGKAYLVTVDNLEVNDVDIFDVTDPRAPKPVGEFDLTTLAQAQGKSIVDAEQANGSSVFLHDMVVKEINGRQTMMASYWDAGYVKVDVEDPAKPVIVSDTDFTGADPETGAPTREGNAHQGEFSADNRYFLAADEDFAPYRSGKFSITTGPNAGEQPGQEIGGGASPASLPGQTLNGPTVFVGYACDASKPIPSRASVGLRALKPGEEAIAVVERGPAGDPANPEPACFPGEKAENAANAGYDAVLFTNRHNGTADADVPFCGSGDFPAGRPIVALCTTHEALHRIFGSPPKYEVPVNQVGEPQIGDTGADVEGSSVFDGWGYAHLYDTSGTKMREINTYAIPEANDPRFAFGFGDLSIHEFATDPSVPLAYSAYYAGGFRVVSFGQDGLKQVGAYVDDRGNNFWGVEQFTDATGNRLVALADRDYGLYIVRYTGPGAYTPPPPSGATTGPARPVTPPGAGGVQGVSTTSLRVSISNKALRLSRTGYAGIRVRCPSAAKASCRGVVRLTSGKRKLGARRFTIKPGKTATVRVKLSKVAQRILRRSKSMRVQVTVDAKAGNNRVSSSRRITLRPASSKLPSNRPR
jgi:hypothetical protein